MNPDNYFLRSEVSNSDLTSIKQLLNPINLKGDKEAAFRFGTLVDAIITEPERVRYDKRMVDEEVYNRDDWELASEMKKALWKESGKDPFLAFVLNNATCQKHSIKKNKHFDYKGVEFNLDVRCKWDWFIEALSFGGDLKSVTAKTQKEFEDAIDLFDWDRSRAWYMDIVNSERDFIYAISKNNCKVFKKMITRGDNIYKTGFEKYNELVFKYWEITE